MNYEIQQFLESSEQSVEIGDWRYRYALRHGNPLCYAQRPVVFCMLNPSTATAGADDPTIHRLKGFARRWKCDSLNVVNLYAIRSTNPKWVKGYDDPVGALNDEVIAAVARWSRHIVVAWGTHAGALRAAHVTKLMVSSGASLVCLGQNNDGSPKHPLYLASTTSLLPYQCEPPQPSPPKSICL